MFAHRLRRWANISTALGQRVLFAVEIWLADVSQLVHISRRQWTPNDTGHTRPRRSIWITLQNDITSYAFSAAMMSQQASKDHIYWRW